MKEKMQITTEEVKKYLSFYFPREKCESILKLLHKNDEYRNRDMAIISSNLPNNEAIYAIYGDNHMSIMNQRERIHQVLIHMKPEECFRLCPKILCFSEEIDVIKIYLNDLFSEESIIKIIKILEERGIWVNDYITVISRTLSNNKIEYKIIKD